MIDKLRCETCHFPGTKSGKACLRKILKGTSPRLHGYVLRQATSKYIRALCFSIHQLCYLHIRRHPSPTSGIRLKLAWCWCRCSCSMVHVCGTHLASDALSRILLLPCCPFESHATTTCFLTCGRETRWPWAQRTSVIKATEFVSLATKPILLNPRVTQLFDK